MNLVNIVFPSGMFGASPWDTELDRMLRRITVAASLDPDGEWAEKYGTNFENDVFMMHQYCWCDDPNCPWCRNCECPDEAFSYYVDDKKVTFEEWVEFHREMVKGLKEKASEEANRRRKAIHEPVCDFCVKYGGKREPNFWYKPTDFKVWWYKYIGRSVETNRDITVEELKELEKHCLQSLTDKKGKQQR